MNVTVFLEAKIYAENTSFATCSRLRQNCVMLGIKPVKNACFHTFSTFSMTKNTEVLCIYTSGNMRLSSLSKNKRLILVAMQCLESRIKFDNYAVNA